MWDQFNIWQDWINTLIVDFISILKVFDENVWYLQVFLKRKNMSSVCLVFGVLRKYFPIKIIGFAKTYKLSEVKFY
jgi:hypothetical protein